MSEADKVEFGRQIWLRRQMKNLSQKGVAERGGLHRETLGRIESGNFKSMRTDTFAGLDRALDLVPGSARRSYETGEPLQPAEDAVAAVVPSADNALSVLAEFADPIDELDSIRNEFPAGAGIDPDTSVRFNRAVDGLMTAKTRLMAGHVTDLLEKSGPPGSRQPQVELVFEKYFDLTGVEPGTTDFIEVLYRRWYVGKRERIDSKTAAKFARRAHSTHT